MTECSMQMHMFTKNEGLPEPEVEVLRKSSWQNSLNGQIKTFCCAGYEKKAPGQLGSELSAQITKTVNDWVLTKMKLNDNPIFDSKEDRKTPKRQCMTE